MRLLIVFIFLLCLPTSVFSKTPDTPAIETKPKEPAVGLLNRVIDGDTFVSINQKIRLWGIDASERGDPYFLASKLYLETILESASFSCYYMDTDRYKRLVMQCFSKGHDVAADMVRMGLAKDYKKYSKGYYSDDELYAKKNKHGMWKEAQK